MVLKNKNIQKFEKAADRTQHYGIRKLTIGAASVLLGTTLWLGRDAIIVKAADENSNSGSDAKEESNSNVSTPTIDDNTKAVVNSASSDSSDVSSDISTSKDTSSAANDVKSSSSEDTSKAVTTDRASSQSSSSDKSSAITSSSSSSDSNAVKSAVTTDAQKSSSQSSSSIENNQSSQVQDKISQKQDNGSSVDSKAAADAGSIGTKSVNDSNSITNNNSAKSLTTDGKLASVGSNGLTANTLDITKGISNLSGAKLAANTLLTSLASSPASGNAGNTNSQGDNKSSLTNSDASSQIDTTGFAKASDWSTLQSAAANTNVKGVVINGNITADGDLTISHDFTITGSKNDDSTTLNLGSHIINNSAKLTLANLTINGAVNGNGNVEIKGKVASNVDSNVITGSAAQQGFGNAKNTASGGFLDDTYNKGGSNWTKTSSLADTNSAIIANISHRKLPNFYASNLNIDSNASLTINRTETGDGIVLKDGAITNGNHITQLNPNAGKLTVGDNGTLNIYLKDSNLTGDQLKSSEFNGGGKNDSRGIDNLNAAVRVNTSGSFITGKDAIVNLRVGHGRGIVFSENNVTTSANQDNTGVYNDNYIFKGQEGQGGWDINQSGTSYFTQFVRANPGIKNTFKLGDGTQLTFMGREAFMLGENASFDTGENSKVIVHNYGHGNAIDMGSADGDHKLNDQSDLSGQMIVGAGSDAEFYSDGKSTDTAGANFGANTYFSLGGGGKIGVMKNATLKVILTGRGQSTYNDNIQINSRDPQLNPEIYVGNNAVFDAESDAKQGNAEIIAIPLTASKTVNLILDNVKYFNVQRTAKAGATTLAPSDPSLVSALGKVGYSGSHNGYGNLIIMNSGRNSQAHIIAYGDLAAFKWDSGDKTNGYNPNMSNVNSVTYDPDLTVSQNFNKFEKSANQTWTNMYGFDIPNKAFSEARNKQVWVDPSGSTAGTNVNSNHGVAFSDLVQGFSPYMSQRLVVIGHSMQPVNEQRTVHYVVQDVDSKGNPIETDPTQMREIANPFVQSAQGDNAKSQELYKDNATDQLVEVERNADGTPKLDANGAVIPVRDSNGNYVSDGTNVNWNAKDGSIVKSSDGHYYFVSYKAPQTITGTDGNGKTVQSLDGNLYQLATDAQLATITTNSDEVVKDGTVANSKNFANTQNEFKSGNYYNTYKDGNLYIVYRQIAGKQGTVNVIFHDTTTNTNITGYGPKTPLSGKEGTAVTGYNPNTDITTLENKGYVRDTTSPVPTGDLTNMPTTYTGGAQTVWINMKHKVTSITPNTPSTDVPKNTPSWAQPTNLTKTVTRTVTYKNDDKTTFTGTVPSNATESIKFNGQAYVDLVNGHVVTVKSTTPDKNGNYEIDNDNASEDSIKWIPASGSFSAVTSPSETNYHVVSVADSNYDDGNHNVKGIDGITKDSKDINITVTYHKNNTPTPPVTQDQNAGLRIIDQSENNKVLNTYTGSGKSNDDISFTGYSSDIVNNYVKQGYEVVGLTNDNSSAIQATMNGTDPTKWSFGKYDNDNNVTQNFTITLKHGTQPVSPTNPGKPGQPINPNDPNGPKYPNGTDNKSLTKNVTRTIHYIIGGNATNKPTAPSDVKQQVTFTESGVLDKVTGQWITPLTWSEDQTAQAVSSPTVPGYHVTNVDRDSAGTTDNLHVGAVTLTHNSSDYTVDVTYEPDNVPETDQNAALRVIDNNDPSHQVELTHFNNSGKENTAISFNGSQQALDAYIKAGYVFQSASNDATKASIGTSVDNLNFGNYDNDPKTTQSFTVYLVHGHVPATPQNPHGVDPKQLTDTTTATVHYVIGGNEANKPTAPADHTQQITWTRHLTVDTVTGKVVPNGTDDTDWKPSSNSYSNVTSPVINGYTTDKGQVTSSDFGNPTRGQNPTITVTYLPNGHVVPVEPDPKDPTKVIPIPGTNTSQDQPQFPTNPNDPTKTTPSYKPNIPGYHPQTGNPGDPVNPGNNPTDNVPVVYVPDTPATPTEDTQHAVVNYLDHDENDQIITTSGDLSGKSGSTINYSTKNTLTNLINDGYVLDTADGGNGFDPNGVAPKFDNDATKNQIFNVILKHGTTPVSPTKPGKPGQPINPNDPNGPKYPDGTDDKSLTVNITRTIHYINGDTRQEMPGHGTVTQTVTYTGQGVLDNVTGQWKTPLTWTASNGKTTFDGVTSPVIDHFHITGVSRDSKDNMNVDQSGTISRTTDSYDVNVIYEPNGKIVPVDPGGNPIPNAPQPQYPTNPQNPSGVTPNEPTPNVPGYTPSKQTVTPNNPGSDTPVVYYQNQVAQVVYRDVNDQNNPRTLDTDGNITGKAGDAVEDSQSATKITNFENEGYELVSNGLTGAVFDNVAGNTQTFYIDFKHKTTTVTPDKPGKPGTPINPNNPNGPKVPQGTDENSLKKTGTQTVHYVGAGDKTPADNKQSFDFTREITYDDVTGQIISTGSWNVTSHTFGNVDTPVVQGYHADKRTAGGTTITPDDLNKTVVVTYSPNGHIIPVDPTNNNQPIPNAPQPQYPTDPTDPTKVVPDEPVPNIPGKTPSTPTVTPKNPGKDTDVPYTNPTADVGTVNVYVHDNTTGQNLPSYNWTSDVDGKAQNVGTKITYNKQQTITDLTNKGYKVLNPDVEIPSTITKGTDNVTIYVEHNIVPVTPENPGKPGQPVNPDNPNGPKYPDNYDATKLTHDVTRTINFVDKDGNSLGSPVEQTVHFTGQGRFDEVTGQWVDENGKPLADQSKGIVWSPDQSINGLTGQALRKDGYHVISISRDGNGLQSIKGVTLTHNDQNYQVVVTYDKNGKIIPVDPNNHNEPIPNAPQPVLPTDPNDPSKVDNGQKPSVPGWTPQTGKPGDPVEPGKNPSDNVTVPYVKPKTPIATTTGVVNYVDDDNYGQSLRRDNLSGNVGDKITYTTNDKIAQFVSEGYVLVGSDPFKDGDETFVKDPAGNTFTIHFKHGTTTVTPDKPGHPGEPINPNNPNGPKVPDGTDENSLKRTGTQTIHYTGAGDSTPADNKQSFDFTRTVTYDNVTGRIISTGSWNVASHTFGEVDTPVINGYHADQRTAGGQVVTPDDLNKTVTVNYSENGKIIPVDQNHNPIPDAPQPVLPTDPNDPTKVVDGKKPSVPGWTPQTGKVGDPVQPGQNPSDNVDVPYTKNPTTVTVTGEVNYVDDDNNGKSLRDDKFSGNVGDKITYTTKDKITDLENQGYELVGNDPFNDGNEVFSKDGNTFTIHFKHGTTTINPDNPGHPGEPINPNDPNGPKWPTGTDSNSLRRTGTQTVHYRYDDGSMAAPDDVTTIEFDHSITYDKVTGKVVKDDGWTPATQTYKTITSPTIDGYIPDRDYVGGDTVASGDSNLDRTYTVVYSSNVVPNPYNPTPSTPATNPVPSTPASQPTKPQASTPASQPSAPKPAGPKPSTPAPTPIHHHKHHNNPAPTPAPQPVSPKPAKPRNTGYNYNNMPHGENGYFGGNGNGNGYSNVMPHGENGNFGGSNVMPHGESNVGPNAENLPAGYSVRPNGEVVDRSGKVVGYVDKNGQVHYTALPQTGENETNELAAALAGGTAIAISMIGLAGVHRKRKN